MPTFNLNGLDCFYHGDISLIFAEYIVFCADKYDYRTNKYIKNIGSITIDGSNASSLLSVSQLPTFTINEDLTAITPATPLNVIKINVENCVDGKVFTSISGPLFRHIDRTSIATGNFIGSNSKECIISTHFSPTTIENIENILTNQASLNDNIIFYGCSFTETPASLDSFDSNFQFDGSICFYSSKITTVEQAITYFTSNPLTVKYVLKEPEIYDIPEEDYSDYENIDRILDGYNEITVLNVPVTSGEPVFSGSVPVPSSIKFYEDDLRIIDRINTAIHNLPTQSDVDKAKEKRFVHSIDNNGNESGEYGSNILHIFDTSKSLSSIDFDFIAPSDNDFVYTYHFIFRSGATPTVLTLPDSVIYPDGFEIEANRIYEINIMENLLSYQSWPVE